MLDGSARTETLLSFCNPSEKAIFCSVFKRCSISCFSWLCARGLWVSELCRGSAYRLTRSSRLLCISVRGSSPTVLSKLNRDMWDGCTFLDAVTKKKKQVWTSFGHHMWSEAFIKEGSSVWIWSLDSGLLQVFSAPSWSLSQTAAKRSSDLVTFCWGHMQGPGWSTCNSSI